MKKAKSCSQCVCHFVRQEQDKDVFDCKIDEVEEKDEYHGVGSGDHLLHLGADLRQLSRLTGVSFGVIQKL